MKGVSMTGYGRGIHGMQPEKPLSSKPPKKPRGRQGMTQTIKGKRARKPTEPIANERIMRGLALQKAIMGVANRKHAHDGSK